MTLQTNVDIEDMTEKISTDLEKAQYLINKTDNEISKLLHQNISSLKEWNLALYSLGDPNMCLSIAFDYLVAARETSEKVTRHIMKNRLQIRGEDMKICEITEQRIREAKKLADEIWNKHIDNNMQFKPDDAKQLISAIWKINGMYEADIKTSKRDNND